MKKPNPEAVKRSVERMVRETLAKCEPARLDADRKAKPKTRLPSQALRLPNGAVSSRFKSK